jgi:hypothetical protein
MDSQEEDNYCSKYVATDDLNLQSPNAGYQLDEDSLNALTGDGLSSGEEEEERDETGSENSTNCTPRSHNNTNNSSRRFGGVDTKRARRQTQSRTNNSQPMGPSYQNDESCFATAGSEFDSCEEIDGDQSLNDTEDSSGENDASVGSSEENEEEGGEGGSESDRRTDEKPREVGHENPFSNVDETDLYWYAAREKDWNKTCMIERIYLFLFKFCCFELQFSYFYI